MSFGFGVGDFLTVYELAAKTRQKWIDVPGEYAAARDEIKNLESILRDLKDLDGRVNVSLPQKDTLDHTIASCRSILEAANKIADAYSTGSSSRLRRNWKRFRSDPYDFRHVRDQLISVVGQLTVVQNNIQLELERETFGSVQDLKTSVVDKKRLKIANWFAPSTFADQQTAQLNLRQPDTANWFLNHRTFLDWRDGPTKTLFCPGIAGSGKSVIFATVLNDLQTRFDQDSSVIPIYFYCNYKRENEQSLPKILAAWARQLFQEQPSIPEAVQEMYDKHVSRGSTPTTAELHLLVQTLMKSYSKVFILVDALDECNNNDGTRDKLLASLTELQSQGGLSVKVMTTCRPGVVRQFDTDPQIEIRAQPEDVERYLNANIAAVIPLVAKKHVLQKQVTEGIAAIVDGMFLLARLHLESLRDKTSIRAVSKALEDLPKGSGSKALERAYEEVLERINKQLEGFKELAYKTLAWLTHAQRELSMDELREAVAIETGIVDLDPELDLPDEEMIVSVCAGLVLVDQESGIVRLAHYTTQIYLEGHHEQWLPGSIEYIANSCFTYLSMEALYTIGIRWDMNFWDIAQRYKLLHYAGKHWGFYTCDLASMSDSVVSSLQKPDFLCLVSQLGFGLHLPYRVSYACEIQDITSLHVCVFFDQQRAMQRLLQQGYGVNAVNSRLESPLHVAVQQRRNEIIAQLLARHDIDVNLQDSIDRTPLYIAAAGGYNEAIALLLAHHNIDVNLQDYNNETPLHRAAHEGSTKTVAQLLSHHDIAVNLRNNDGRTPLYIAAAGGCVEVVAQLLARQDIDVNLQDGDGDTALSLATKKRNFSIATQLLNRSDIRVDEGSRERLRTSGYTTVGHF